MAAPEVVPEFSPLAEDTTADVVVVGGGITGLTAAYLLAKAGKSVAVFERDRVARIDSGHTSAHLTMVTDTRLGELSRRFGRTHAQAVWDAGLAGIAQMDQIARDIVARDNTVACDFQWVAGYLHVPIDGNTQTARDAIQEDAAVAADLGFDVEYIDAVPLLGVPGMRVDCQARVHPRKYLAGLARAITDAGGRIYEQSDATEFCASPRSVGARGYRIACDDIVIATHNPIVGTGTVLSATLFQTKLALYTTYVVAGRVQKGVVPDGLWWDTADPYHYLRVAPEDEADVVIFGGEDHKTGQQTDTDACYQRLEAQLISIVPGVQLTHRWSGQVIETPDGLPYIGQSAERQLTATGFAGNGLTFGTVGGMMMADAILGRSNPWRDLFDPARKALGRALWEYVKENKDYPYYMIRDRFAGAEGRSFRAIERGQGQIVEYKGSKVAAFRDVSGAVSVRSATCTHMGCVVGWNGTERTWDCPCHGSRFKPTGEVIAGPAESPLAEVD
jgi:glycine/D-amino acid oxidase-like deaminating enzyme/nitrite reductase/ring-hydroxylating ferredoxin subunit